MSVLKPIFLRSTDTTLKIPSDENNALSYIECLRPLKHLWQGNYIDVDFQGVANPLVHEQLFNGFTDCPFQIMINGRDPTYVLPLHYPDLCKCVHLTLDDDLALRYSS